jgi:hypothetical protein
VEDGDSQTEKKDEGHDDFSPEVHRYRSVNQQTMMEVKKTKKALMTGATSLTPL